MSKLNELLSVLEMPLSILLKIPGYNKSAELYFHYFTYLFTNVNDIF
jgi:hypothetical protein